jgi:hypothetical protein
MGFAQDLIADALRLCEIHRGECEPGSGEMRKSIWRLIGGVLLLAGVSNSLRHMPTNRHELSYVITYLALNILLAAIGVWLAVSYFRRSN